MTRVVNKATGEEYISKVSTEKKNWILLMVRENGEFFEGADWTKLCFIPL